MIDPNRTTDKLEHYLKHISNEIELNLEIQKVDWSDPAQRSGIIALVIAMWVVFSREDGINLKELKDES